NIRPGTYSRDGGATTVLNLGDAIPGTSVANRVTFRPDAAAGGNVNNVILSADFNATSAPRALVVIRANYVTLRSLTFKDVDVHPVGDRVGLSEVRGHRAQRDQESRTRRRPVRHVRGNQDPQQHGRGFHRRREQ